MKKNEIFFVSPIVENIYLSVQPVDMISDKRSIESDAEPLSRKKEEDVEENVEDVLGQHQGVQTGALVYRILVVGFQLIKSNDLQWKKFKCQNLFLYGSI